MAKDMTLFISYSAILPNPSRISLRLSGAKVDIFFGNSKQYPTFLISFAENIPNIYTMDKNKVVEFIKHSVLERFALGADAASQEEVNSNIRKGIMIRGTNLWVLIFAIFIASLGLNTNSTAVIIGAMLISPLMGPIIGMGYSMGVYDFALLKESFRNFLIMIVVSLATSAIFFTLPLITTTQSSVTRARR